MARNIGAVALAVRRAVFRCLHVLLFIGRWSLRLTLDRLGRYLAQSGWLFRKSRSPGRAGRGIGLLLRGTVVIQREVAARAEAVRSAFLLDHVSQLMRQEPAALACAPCEAALGEHNVSSNCVRRRADRPRRFRSYSVCVNADPAEVMAESRFRV